MKTFYTERDIEDMHAAGVTEIGLDDDVVLTDLAREKAIVLGMHIKRVDQRSGQPSSPPRLAVVSAAPSTPKPEPAPTISPSPSSTPDEELASRVKAAVITRLGTTEHNGLLDIVIPQVLARLATSPTGQTSSSSSASNNDY